MTGDSISERINFALIRKYGDRLPKDRHPRAQWVAQQYDAKLYTARGWLFDNRKPRAPYLARIAEDTGVDANWLAHGGTNPYLHKPYEPEELDPNDTMRTFSLFDQIGSEYGFSYRRCGALLKDVVNALTQHRLSYHNDDEDYNTNENRADVKLALVCARLLNEVNNLMEKVQRLEDTYHKEL